MLNTFLHKNVTILIVKNINNIFLFSGQVWTKCKFYDKSSPFEILIFSRFEAKRFNRKIKDSRKIGIYSINTKYALHIFLFNIKRI